MKGDFVMWAKVETYCLVGLICAVMCCVFKHTETASAVCIHKKCKMISKWGYVTKSGDKCFEFDMTDCVVCNLSYFDPPADTKTKCDEEITKPLKVRLCSTGCKLSCKLETAGDQEAACTGAGDFNNSGTKRFVCKEEKGTGIDP